MSFGCLGSLGAGFGRLGSGSNGVSPSSGMPAAPTGFHWEFVTYNGERVKSDGAYVVALVEN